MVDKLEDTRNIARNAYTSLLEMEKNGEAFFENAGGSQTPDVVCKAIYHHMVHYNAQLGAGYERSNKATKSVADAHDFMLDFVNGRDIGEVVLGASSSILLSQ